MSAMSVVPTTKITLSPNASAIAPHLKAQLMGLNRVVFHNIHADLHKVFANFEMAAFTMTCLAHEALKDVKNSQELSLAIVK
jgi:hypothetical protein